MRIIFVNDADWATMQDAIARIDKTVAQIAIVVNAIKAEEDQIMSQLTDQLDALEANTKAIDDAEDSAEAAFTRLAAMIADLKTGVTDPAVVARINAVSTELAARASRLAAAVVATPSP
jgi:septal ring factor EnvC (AmiA/AmiB activator)